MSTVHDTIDEAVARVAPTTSSIATEWTFARQDAVLTGIVGTQAGPVGDARGVDIVHELMTDAPVARARRRRILLPLAASVAVLAAGAGTVVAVLPGAMGSNSGAVGSLPPGEPFDPPAGLSAQALPAGEWAYSVYRQGDVDAQGRLVTTGRDAMTIRSWTSARGHSYEIRSGSRTSCSSRPDNGAPGYTVAYFGSLPTDPLALRAYLRRHANGGSSSRDEAVFVAVGDALGAADGLASPKVRGAFVAALSRTAGVLVHRNARDQLGRPALRLDFVDQQIRPGEVQSLYFSPTDFSLLERRDGSNGAPDRYAGPSPAYTHSASTGRDPQVLTGRAFVQTYSGRKVVKTAPASVRRCKPLT